MTLTKTDRRQFPGLFALLALPRADQETEAGGGGGGLPDTSLGQAGFTVCHPVE